MGIWDKILRKAINPIVQESFNDFKKQTIEKGVVASNIANWTANPSGTRGKGTAERDFNRGVNFQTLRDFSKLYPILRSCFVAGTPVVTAQGVTPIEEIEVGDTVLTHTGEWNKVTEKFTNPHSGTLVKIRRAGSNIPLVCTPDHPFLITPVASQKSKNYQLKWRLAKDMVCGEYLVLPRIKEKKEKKVVTVDYLYHGKRKRRLLEVNKHLLRLIGWYLAEGSTTKYTVNFVLSAKEIKYAKEIVRSAKKIFRQKAGTNIKERHGGTTLSVDIYSKVAATFFAQFGRGAKNKFVPQWVLNLPNYKLKKVIVAYWLGDGCSAKEAYLFDTISESLAFGLQVALNKLGMATTIRQDSRNNSSGLYGKTHGTIYRIGLYGEHAEKFNNLVGDDKKACFSKHRYRHKYNAIDKDFAYTRIASIEKLPKQNTSVYNIEVDGDHSYIALGVASHNCINYRKRQVNQLAWDIAPKEVGMSEDKQIHKEIDELRKFFKYPAGDKTMSFRTFVNKIIEDLLVLDAVAIYRRKNRAGGLYGYLPVDGATIELMVNKDGTTPTSPSKAYIQKIKGETKAKLSVDELIYRCLNPRTDTPYGMSPVEALIITVTTALKLDSYNLSYLCYDEMTEILTQNGWKKFSDLVDRDFVATRSPTGKFEWQQPLKRVSFDYDDNMVRFKSRTVDLMVTPNHRMLVDYRTSDGEFADKNKGVIKRADWFLQTPKTISQNYLAPTTSSWKGKNPKYFKLPGYVIERTGVFSGYAFAGRDKNGVPIRSNKKFVTKERTITYKKPPIKIPTKDWVAFLGIYLAEGWTRADNNKSKHEVYISQSEKSTKLVDIKKLLKRLPFNFWREGTDKYVCCDARLWQYLKPLGKCYQKYVPAEIKTYSPKLLKILWEWMIKGDGHKQDRNITYSTTSEKLADDCQEILQKIGSDSRKYSIKQPTGNIIKIKKVKTTRIMYKVIERLSKHRSLSCAAEESYEGKVYSVKVPNGIVYVRRNGYPAWCGNSEGNIPEGFVELPQEIASSPDQLALWQKAWDAMISGDPRRQRKIKFLPQGMKWQPIKKIGDMEFEKFEKWLLLVTSSLMETAPQSIGFNFDRGKGAVEAQWEIGKERGLFPLADFFKEIFDFIIQEDFGKDHLQFVWTNINPTNKLEEAKVFSQLVSSGAVSVDEWRIGEGLKPIGMKHCVSTPTGPIFVHDLISRSESGNPILPDSYTIGNNPIKPPKNLPTDTTTPKKKDKDGKTETKSPKVQNPKVQNPKIQNPKVSEKIQKIAKTETVEELKRWKRAAANDLKQGREFRNFKTGIIDTRTKNMLQTGLATIKKKDELDMLFDPFIGQENEIIGAIMDLYDDVNSIIKNDELSSSKKN